jgi:hypothetical protein
MYRVADIAWPKLGRLDSVAERRALALNRLGAIVLRPRANEAERITSRVQSALDLAAAEWCSLFDLWNQAGGQFTFVDGFAALFFIRLLWLGQPLVLRGHFNARWALETSLVRAKRSLSSSDLSEVLSNADAFLAELQNLTVLRDAYPSGLPPKHATAIKQHYGFPTEYIDCTLNYDVALFFAEGGTDYAPKNAAPELGRIYAFPPFAITQRSEIVTLSPRIMRPSVQRATFITTFEGEDISHLSQFSFAYRHQDLPIWSGLSGIGFGAPAGLGRYLFPANDPVEQLAVRCRKNQIT